MKEGVKDRPLSRLQCYYDGRAVENCVKIDSGLEIRDAIKCAADLGVAVEPLWPYNIDRFRQKPFQKVYDNATQVSGSNVSTGFTRCIINQSRNCEWFPGRRGI
jgi:hypothetical protein